MNINNRPINLENPPYVIAEISANHNGNIDNAYKIIDMAAWQSLGKVDYGMKSSEQGNVKFRRSIYAIKDIKKGEQFTKENIRSIRPGFGLKPKYYEQVLGKIAKCDIKRGTPTSFDLIL